MIQVGGSPFGTAKTFELNLNNNVDVTGYVIGSGGVGDGP